MLWFYSGRLLTGQGNTDRRDHFPLPAMTTGRNLGSVSTFSFFLMPVRCDTDWITALQSPSISHQTAQPCSEGGSDKAPGVTATVSCKHKCSAEGNSCHLVLNLFCFSRNVLAKVN